MSNFLVSPTQQTGSQQRNQIVIRYLNNPHRSKEFVSQRDVDEIEVIQASQSARITRLSRPWISSSMSVADPFGTRPSCVIQGPLLDMQMSDTRQNLLTMVTTRTNDSRAVSFADGIMSFMRDSETTLTSVTAAAMMYWRIARGLDNSRYQAELLASGRALTLLSKAMASDTAVTEANIWAVLAMSYCGGGELLKLRSGKLPRRSFLRELQSLHVYGRLRPNDAHVMGLLKLTGMLGGIYRLKTYGIAQIMSFCAILESTRHMTKPGLPFVPYAESSIVDGRIAMESHEWSQAGGLCRLGVGFHKVWPESERTRKLKCAISNLCDFTIIIENYIQGRSAHKAACEITDARNYTQHTLMALGSNKEIDEQHESTRIACIVYSYLIVMPLPPVVGIYEKIATALQNAIEQEDKQVIAKQQSRSELRLWILVMGAIITIGLNMQEWFVLRIGSTCDSLDIRKWREFTLLLGGFLWHPSTNEPNGRDIWTTVKSQDQYSVEQIM